MPNNPAIKLTDLNPRWVNYGGDGVTGKNGNPIPERDGVGISFVCPCGKCDHRVFLHLTNPRDGGKPIDIDRPHWHRFGDNFEDMSLTPSILRRSGCSWHGYLTNGYLKEC